MTYLSFTPIIMAATVLVSVSLTPAHGFANTAKAFATPISTHKIISRATTKLNAYIEADETVGEEFVDEGLGGVRLAQESVVIVSGSIQKDDSIVAKDLKRYSKLMSLPESDISEVNVLCKGTGTELYKDPGSSPQKSVTLAPTDAVRDALSSLEIANKIDQKVYINFAGGDDLMMHEVLEGVDIMLSGLNLEPNVSVEFRSLCHESFPLEKCSVVVVAIDNDKTGDVYWHEGQWWTVSDIDLNVDA